MVNLASQQDYEKLVDFSEDFESRIKERSENTDWETSPFNFVRGLRSTTKGMFGRQLAQEWAAINGFETSQEQIDNQLYVIIHGIRVQVKMSTLWESGTYRFQQIRDTDFDFGFFIGISPNDIHVWVVPKQVLDIHVIGTLGHHTGQEASDTWWLQVNVNAVPRWLDEYGSQLSDARDIITDFLEEAASRS